MVTAGPAWSRRPREVPGFAWAVAAGLTPARPSLPPSLRPGTTAHRALVHCGVALCVAAVLVVLALGLGPSSGGQASLGQLGVVLGSTATGIGVVLTAIGRFRRVLLAELAAGYVTTTFHQGLFWFVDRPGPRMANSVVGWVWDGVWVLDSSGRVVSQPDPAVEPPGFYPSPNRPGTLELWTGCQWLGVHRDG